MSNFKKFSIIFILSLALTIIVLDTTLLNVSLGSIIRDLHTDIQSIQWVITAYSLTLAALTITGGRFGDLFGRKRMFVIGAVIFAIGSFIASISTNVGMMIAGEAIIEGIGAAMMMPATSSLLMSNFKGRDRALAFGIWGGVAGAASAIGPILGGFLATNYSWRWGFRINVFVVIILCLAAFLIPESKDKEEKPTLDWLGVILSSFGLLSLVFGVIESSIYGWWMAKQTFVIGDTALNFIGGLSIVPFALLISVILLTLFVLWELHLTKQGKTPLVSMKLFTNRQYTSGALTTMVLSLGQSGIIFSIPVFLQAVRGYDAFQTGLSLVPMSVTLLVVAPLGAILSKKVRPKLMIQIGLLLNVAAMVVLRWSLNLDTTTTTLIPGLVLYGAGMGIVMSQINNLTLSAVSVEEAGEASGVNNTLRQVGATFGSAIIGAVLLGALTTNLSSGIMQSQVIPEAYKTQISEAITTQTSNVEFGGGAKLENKMPPQIAQEITKISHVATIDANKEALFYGSLFAILGFLISFTLPNVTNVEKGQSVASGH